MDELPASFCPQCGNPVTPLDIYCPKCGKLLKEQNTTISIGRQVYMYTVSALAPPFGLIWMFKYLFKETGNFRKVGIIAGVITIISLIITLWVFGGIFSSLQSQLGAYQNLGY